MTPNLPNLRALRAVVGVATDGSVSAAARAMHVTQPAVTQAIAGLERELGAPLFVRGSVGMTPTAEGRLLVARALRVLEQLRAGIEEASSVREGAPRDATGDPLRSVTAAQLRSLVAVVETGSFAAAARLMGISRASLHRAARSLEPLVGAALFETTSFGLRPTRQAAELARRIRLAAAEYAQARDEIGVRASPVRGRTVIGAMPLARSWLVPRAVLDFSTRWPDHAISILDGPYETLLEALRRGTADVLVGALRDPEPADDVVQQHLFDDPLAIVVRSEHPLARRRRVTVRDLARYPWIAPREGSPLRQRFHELFARGDAESPPNPVECNSLVAARELLLGSDRVMLSSAQQVHHELDMKLLTVLPHPHGPVSRSIGLTVRRDWRPTERQQALLDLLRAAAGAATFNPPTARISTLR